MISLALLPTMQKHYLVISLLTMCHFVFHAPSVSEFNIQVYFASWRAWIRYVKHATERYSPLTSMCNAKTANVSIIPHVWDKDSCNVSSTWYCPHCIQTILPFNHFDEDEDFFVEVMEQRLNCSFRFHEMNSRVFVPFEINQDSNTPFSEIDPDHQFYT